MSIRSLGLALALVAAQAAASHAQKAAKLTWGPGPPTLPAGARMALVSGDPGKPAPFELQIDMPNGYVIPPHWHPTDEHVTVNSGQLRYGMADRIDRKAAKTLRPGQSVTLKAKMNHFALARGRTVLTVKAIGPFEINYVNPADDPRKPTP